MSFRVSVVRGLTSSGGDVTQQCRAAAQPEGRAHGACGASAATLRRVAADGGQS